MAFEYLGTALKYPVSIDQYGRGVTVSGLDTIPQSIAAILNTPKGSRFFLPEYGSDIHLLMFEPNDDILVTLLDYIIKTDLGTWEKRMKVIDIAFDVSEDKIDSEIIYKVLKSNEFQSFIYPFYREIIY